MAKNVKVIQATSPILSAQSQISVKKRRVAAYARVSTEKDEQQNSYEAQIEYYTRYIKSNPEWIFAGIYSDATDIIGLKQNPTYGRRFSPIFLIYRAFCGAKRKMLL